MASELRVDKIHNEGGDNDSGINLATNDNVKIDIAGSTKLTVDGTHVKHNDGSGNARFGIDNDNMLLIDEDTSIATYCNGSTMAITESNGRLTTYGNVASGFGMFLQNTGDDANRYGLAIRCGTNDGSGTNYVITFYNDNIASQGNVKWTSGTITYETFTAAHPCSLPDADKATGYPYGTLLEFTDIYYADDGAGNPTERGQIYVVQKTSTQYSRKVLGVYGSDMLARAATSGPYANNLHSTEVLGDGHILCNGSGGNIKVGDGICASATAGIGQKADKLGMIIGIAQKDITFSGSETVLVPVQYGLQQFTPWTD